MYIMDDMVDIGLPKGTEWPEESAYRIVAQNILLANPNVSTADQLQTGVKNILKIPIDKIQTITVNELSNYGFEIATNLVPIDID